MTQFISIAPAHVPAPVNGAPGPGLTQKRRGDIPPGALSPTAPELECHWAPPPWPQAAGPAAGSLTDAPEGVRKHL